MKNGRTDVTGLFWHAVRWFESLVVFSHARGTGSQPAATSQVPPLHSDEFVQAFRGVGPPKHALLHCAQPAKTCSASILVMIERQSSSSGICRVNGRLGISL